MCGDVYGGLIKGWRWTEQVKWEIDGRGTSQLEMYMNVPYLMQSALRIRRPNVENYGVARVS